MRAVLLLSLMAGGFSQTPDNDQNYMDLQSSDESGERSNEQSGEGSTEIDYAGHSEESAEASAEQALREASTELATPVISPAPTPQSKDAKKAEKDKKKADKAAKKAAEKAAKSKAPTPVAKIPQPANQQQPSQQQPSQQRIPQLIPQQQFQFPPQQWTPLPSQQQVSWQSQTTQPQWASQQQFGQQPSPIQSRDTFAVGGDGSCMPNSGYMWCASKQKCLQPWVETCSQYGQVTNTGVKTDKPIVPATGLYNPVSTFSSGFVPNPSYVISSPGLYTPSSVSIGPISSVTPALYTPRIPLSAVYPAFAPSALTFSSFATSLPSSVTFTTPTFGG